LISSLNELKNTVNRVMIPISRDGLLKTLSNAYKTLGRDRVKRNLARFSRAGKAASGLYLMYSFGIAPLFSDMRKMESVLRDTKSGLDKHLRKRKKALVSVHRQCGYTFSYIDPVGGHDISYLDVGSLRFRARLSGDKNRRTCTVRGYRDVDYDSAAFKRLDYAVSRFGVTGPASFVWELIPFSFVVDWFLDLRHITNTLDNLLTGNSKRIVDICVSDKYQITESGYLNSGYNPTTQGRLMCTVTTNQYTRNPVTSYNKIGVSGRFGKKQASLTAALLYQKVANLR